MAGALWSMAIPLALVVAGVFAVAFAERVQRISVTQTSE